MKTFKALLWKECQTLKYVWVAGLLLFYAFGFWPSLFGSGAFESRPYQSIAGISMTFGNVYCVILAISLVCRDFQNPLEFFWRARPISLVPMVMVKYFLGLVTIVAISFVPLGLALLWKTSSIGNLPDYKMYPDFEVHILCFHTFTLILIFTVCFLTAALLRKAVESALLSFAAILIVYFFPVVFPPLGFLSVINLTTGWEGSIAVFKPAVLNSAQDWSPLSLFTTHLNLGVFVVAFNEEWVLYVLSMVILSLVAFAAAVWVLNRGWSFSLDQKSVAWSLAAVALLLFGAASFEVGTNLECERVIRSTQERSVQGIAQEGGRGVLVYQFDSGSDPNRTLHLGFQEFDLNREEVYGRSVEDPWVIGPGRMRYGSISYSWDNRSPHLVHYIARDVSRTYTDRGRWNEERKSLALATVDFDTPKSATPIFRIDLRPFFLDDTLYHEPGFTPGITRVSDASLVLNLSFGNLLRIFDIRDPINPVPADDSIKEHFGWELPPGHLEEEDRVKIELPRIPGLSPEERLSALENLQGRGSYSLGRTLYVSYGQFQEINVYRRVSIDSGEVVFEKMCEITGSPLERLLHSGVRQLILMEPYLVHVYGGLTLYDLSDPSRPVQVGHYSSGIDNLNTVFPLGDGRILAAGNHLHVVRLPERTRRGV